MRAVGPSLRPLDRRGEWDGFPRPWRARLVRSRRAEQGAVFRPNAERTEVGIAGGVVAVAFLPGYLGYVGGLNKFNADRAAAYHTDADARAEVNRNIANSICPDYQKTLAGDDTDDIAYMKVQFGEVCKDWKPE